MVAGYRFYGPDDMFRPRPVRWQSRIKPQGWLGKLSLSLSLSLCVCVCVCALARERREITESELASERARECVSECNHVCVSECVCVAC